MIVAGISTSWSPNSPFGGPLANLALSGHYEKTAHLARLFANSALFGDVGRRMMPDSSIRERNYPSGNRSTRVPKVHASGTETARVYHTCYMGALGAAHAQN